MPYWSLYLEQWLNFTPALIGQLMTITVVSRIIAPNFWGYIADRTGQRLRLVQLGAFMLTIFWCGISYVHTFWTIALVLLAYSFFQNAILAQFEAVTVAHLGVRREHYGRIRLWGSLGFIAAVVSLGTLFDVTSLRWLPVALAFCSLASWLASLSVPNIATACRADAKTSLWSILRRPAVVGFLSASFLLQLSHAPYYTFYSLFLESHHYSHATIGWFWALGVAAEVVAFTQMHRLLPALGERRVLLGSLLLAALRWWVIGHAVDQPLALIAMQLLHSASFATFHSACVSLIYRYFDYGHQGKGQALYSMLWGLGVALGSYWAGLAWTGVGPVKIYSAAALICLFAWVCVLMCVRDSSSERAVLAAGEAFR